MSQLESTLKDLLVREAHLKLSREQLMPIWAEKEAELRAMQAAKPMFLPVFSKRRRAEYETRLTALLEVVGILRKGVEVIDRIEPHVKKLIEEQIENILREDCAEYVQALAALRQKEDWARCLDRVSEKIFEFARALGNVRNLACSGYARHAAAYSQGAVQAFTLAVEAAKKIEEEVVLANKISDTQARQLVENGFNLRPLPKLQQTEYGVWVSRISALPLVEAQVQFDLLIEQTTKLHAKGIPELRARAQSVDEMQVAEVRNFLLAAWDQFRAEIASEIYPGDTEASVAETERMLLSKAQISVLGWR